MENNQFVNRLKTYLYKGGFSYENYPQKLKYIKKINKNIVKIQNLNKLKFSFKIQLASFSTKKNVSNFWSKLNLMTEKIYLT